MCWIVWTEVMVFSGMNTSDSDDYSAAVLVVVSIESSIHLSRSVGVYDGPDERLIGGACCHDATTSSRRRVVTVSSRV